MLGIIRKMFALAQNPNMCTVGTFDGVKFRPYSTPFENAQRWMGQNTFPILPLNDDNMIGEH